jgi:hypothetical protein
VTRLGDLAYIVRSKNAGPFRLTLDVLFADEETYRRVRDSGAIDRDVVARLYRIAPEEVTDLVWFDPGRALKASLVRPVPQGSVGDGDIYGAQQHAPLLDVEVP